jgi:glycosyltransferase involved in cell wall biosynthesis
MRILVLSNFYPPYYIGGYELGCRDAVEALRARGHEVKVLTSTYGIEKPECEGDIYRWLETDIEWRNWKEQGSPKYILKLLKKELNNKRSLRRLCEMFPPDVVYIWKLTHTSISLAFSARDLGYPTCFYIFDHWLTEGESDDRWYRLWYRSNTNRFYRWLKKPFIFLFETAGLLHGSSLDLQNVQFASSFLKQAALHAGRPVADAKIILWGIDTKKFPFNPSLHIPPRLLFVGQIIPIKGVHTAVEAMEILVRKEGFDTLTLTLVGRGGDPEYVDHLKKIVKASDLSENIYFAGFVPHENLLSIYRNHDILLFPSVWEEPFGIVILEAMSCGLGVIGTATGGSAEILQSDETAALIFCKEDAEACAAQIRRLIENPALLDRIRTGGRHRVEETFNFEHTMDTIEKSLKEIIH